MSPGRSQLLLHIHAAIRKDIHRIFLLFPSTGFRAMIRVTVIVERCITLFAGQTLNDVTLVTCFNDSLGNGSSPEAENVLRFDYV